MRRFLPSLGEPFDGSSDGDEWFKLYLELPFSRLAMGEKADGIQNDIPRC